MRGRTPLWVAGLSHQVVEARDRQRHIRNLVSASLMAFRRAFAICAGNKARALLNGSRIRDTVNGCLSVVCVLPEMNGSHRCVHTSPLFVICLSG